MRGHVRIEIAAHDVAEDPEIVRGRRPAEVGQLGGGERARVVTPRLAVLFPQTSPQLQRIQLAPAHAGSAATPGGARHSEEFPQN